MSHTLDLSTHQIGKYKYNYLLPAMRKNLFQRHDTRRDITEYVFIGTLEEFRDAMQRCQYLEPNAELMKEEAKV